MDDTCGLPRTHGGLGTETASAEHCRNKCLEEVRLIFLAMSRTIIEHYSFIFRYTAITGHTLMGGKMTATSGQRGMSAGVGMGLRHLITSLARSGWNASALRTACGTYGGGILAT